MVGETESSMSGGSCSTDSSSMLSTEESAGASGLKPGSCASSSGVPVDESEPGGWTPFSLCGGATGSTMRVRVPETTGDLARRASSVLSPAGDRGFVPSSSELTASSVPIDSENHAFCKLLIDYVKQLSNRKIFLQMGR